MEKEENTGHGTHTCKKRDAVHSGSYYLVSSISNGIYPHIEQVAVVLQTFKTTGTVRCPITSAPILLVAAGLIMLHDKKEDSALQLSGSTPALRYDTAHCSTRHRRKAMQFVSNINYSIHQMSKAFNGISCAAEGPFSVCTHVEPSSQG